MLMKNLFDAAVVEEQVARINKLTPATTPQWGKMSVDQMLAHLNVAYVMAYENTLKKPNWLLQLVLRKFVKHKVVGPEPYARNSPTAPVFKMVGQKDFDAEKAKLIGYMRRVQNDGATVFSGKSSASFGPLTTEEWNVLFYKHLDHHLTQFGV